MFSLLQRFIDLLARVVPVNERLDSLLTELNFAETEALVQVDVPERPPIENL